MAFLDRADAGRRLADRLGQVFPGPSNRRAVVEGMARGGIPVAFEIARALRVPLDVVVVRKLGHPRQPELGLGAIGEDGVRVVNGSLIEQLQVEDSVIEAVAARESAELARRVRVYRGDRPPVSLQERTAIVVDDGLATGFTARAAVEVMRRRGAARVVLAVPVGPPGAVAALGRVADEVVCVEVTEHFFGISEWYVDFHQVRDEEVARLLEDASAFVGDEIPDDEARRIEDAPDEVPDDNTPRNTPRNQAPDGEDPGER